MINTIFSIIRFIFLWPKKKKLNKNAEFLSKKDIKQFLNSKNSWLLIDGKSWRLSEKNSFEHLALISRTWWWKTTSFIIPNILTLDNCSMVITDPSWEIAKKTIKSLVKKGFNILIINPLNPKTETYNPLIRSNSDEELKEISKILINSNIANETDSFWNNGAEKIITIILKCLKNKEKQDKVIATLKDLQKYLNYFLSKEFDKFIIDYWDDELIDEYKWLLLGNEKTTQSFLSTAQISIDSLSNPNISNLLNSNSINFNDLRDKKTVLFIQVPEQKIPYYAFILNLIYAQLFNFSMEKLEVKQPIYFLLDEFGHLKIPYFSSIITTIRKYKVSVSIILQSISQLETKYWRTEAETILNGWVGSKIFYSWTDPKTSKMLEDIIWKTKIKQDESNNIREENLLNASNIRTLEDNQWIYIYSNKKPILLEITPFYKNRKFKNIH
mgnify:CR=1 FL=1